MSLEYKRTCESASIFAGAVLYCAAAKRPRTHDLRFPECAHSPAPLQASTTPDLGHLALQIGGCGLVLRGYEKDAGL